MSKVLDIIAEDQESTTPIQYASSGEKETVTVTKESTTASGNTIVFEHHENGRNNQETRVTVRDSRFTGGGINFEFEGFAPGLHFYNALKKATDIY